MSNADKLKKQILNSLKNDFGGIEKRVLDDVFAFIDKLDSTNGIFAIPELDIAKIEELQRIITKALIDSGYTTKINGFVRDLGKITQSTIGALDQNGFTFQRQPLNDIELKWQKMTTDNLKSAGLNEGFVKPVMSLVDNSITFGKSVTELRKDIENFIVGGKDTTGKLKSYVTTTAREVVSTMQGVQMNSVANELGFDYLQYTGGLLDDSRGQCFRWVHELNGKIPKAILGEEIRAAYKNQAAKKVIEFAGEKHLYSGMKPDTTIENFIILRGGWGCIHSAFPRKDKKK